MAQKIILFVSMLREGAQEKEYHCPDGSTVKGAQTNEAPLRYLLRRYPETSELLCIVTPEAETAMQHLQKVFAEERPELILHRIPYDEGMQDFSGTPLNEILSHVEPEDEILLETTGGLRNAIMYLLLLSRVLSYVSVRTVCAVYSQLNPAQIKDVSDLIAMFDLVGGMQELTSFGSVRTLRAYYGQEPEDPSVAALLTALEALGESITLCRTRQLGARMKEFGQALSDAKHCNDPLMKALLPAFRNKFGKKLNTVSLIKWCVESDMLQQALTVYTERIPTLIMTRGDLLRVAGAQPIPAKDYEDPDAVQFLQGFLLLSGHDASAGSAGQLSRLREYVPAHISTILCVSRGESATYPKELKPAVENLALICRLAYPKGSYQYNWTESLPPEKSNLSVLDGAYGVANTVEGMLKSVGVYKKEHLAMLLEWSELDMLSAEKPDYITTLEHLEELLPGSGYEVRCSVEQIKTIARDYLYIKALRNMANHANESGTSEQKRLMQYLEEYGYRPLEQVTVNEMRRVISQALDNLRTRRGKE